jgi:transcriptional regulator with GAF, ATPase, and Fis domain
MSTHPDEELALLFASVARELEAEKSPDLTRTRVTAMALATISGCEHAAISLVHRAGRITTVAPTSDLAERVDAIQYDTGQGPCLDAIDMELVYQTDDLAREHRWPEFSRRTVAEVGVRSMLSFRLFVESDTMGALNLYSTRTGAFDERSDAVGAVLAAHAAVAMESADQRMLAENLALAVDTNRRIGMATGILMAQRKITEEQAFAALRRASQSMNTKVRDLADIVVETGQLPGRRRD